MTITAGTPLVDVRSPSEFCQGHVPGAFNIPLFTNEERAQIGTTYRQMGRDAAIVLGFDLTGPKWSQFIRQALQIAPQKRIAVHCWRGGMRSDVMAWALNLYGFEVVLIEKGYKQYRKWVLQQLENTQRLLVVGGMTGSGKTRILHALRSTGEQVIDLEDLAQHRGSTYGTLNTLVQPSQEQFENNLAEQLQRMDPQRTIWIEDESVTIGKRLIPKPFWNQMQAAFVFHLQVPLNQRAHTLVQEYGSLDKEFLVACTDRIRKRLGPEQAKYAIEAIRNNNMDEFVRRVLVYYDKTYRRGLDFRAKNRICMVPVAGNDPLQDATSLLDCVKTHAAAAADVNFE